LGFISICARVNHSLTSDIRIAASRRNLSRDLSAEKSRTDIYSGNLDGTVDYFNLSTHSVKLFTTVGYLKGIAVDNARGPRLHRGLLQQRHSGYNPSGTLLTTIK
jgi:hypothetical protein